MLLESFFMEAYAGGYKGIVAMVSGSVLAISEGMATGAIFKVLSFSGVFRRIRARRHGLEGATVLATGILLVVLFALSTAFVPETFIGGLPQVLVARGLMIESSSHQLTLACCPQFTSSP
ncbi:hypothetical protein [Thermogymnomonas acidicola]|nr:hypothetical protein [Thermogymnomonas acidicola]